MCKIYFAVRNLNNPSGTSLFSWFFKIIREDQALVLTQPAAPIEIPTTKSQFFSHYVKDMLEVKEYLLQ